jgi:hypothetical protein
MSEALSIKGAAETSYAAATSGRQPAYKYPLTRAARCFIEPWMLVAALVALAAAFAINYARPLPTLWLLATPAITLAATAAVRAKRNVRKLKHRRAEHVGRLQREARYAALVPAARRAVDELRAVKGSILDKSALKGHSLTSILARLDEYELDYIDLLFLFQERSRSLEAIRARDTAAVRRALEEDRERLRGADGDEGDAITKRTLSALSHRATLLDRQDVVARDLDRSLELIMQQSLNIKEFFSLVSNQVSSLPLGVSLASNAEDFEALSDTIQMTKETLNGIGENY